MRDGAAAGDAMLSTPSSTLDDVIKLNVGGARFETSRAVLTKVEDSMLGRMFGRCEAMLQPDPLDGSISIDRDGERFRLILDFLRGDPPDGPRLQRMIRALPEAAQDALMQELDFFGLVTAVFGAPPWTDGATFRPGPDMEQGRFGCAAVFAGGRLVVAGGYSGASALNATEVLDARTMTFTAGPTLLEGRFGCAAVQMDAERVLVVSGWLKTTEILHVSTLTFTPGPNLLSCRPDCAAVALDARRILIVGGSGAASEVSSTEILSLDTMAFAPGPSTATQRHSCAAFALDEHRIMVAGGRLKPGCLNTTEVLDIRTMTFSAGPSMGAAREGCAAVSVDARHVIVICGRGSSGTALATTELLDISMMEFSSGPTMGVGRKGCAAVRLDVSQGRQVLVVGGYDGRGASSTTELLENDGAREGPQEGAAQGAIARG